MRKPKPYQNDLSLRVRKLAKVSKPAKVSEPAKIPKPAKFVTKMSFWKLLKCRALPAMV